jgi:hypothetical protein
MERFVVTPDLPEGSDLEFLQEADGTLSFEVMDSLPDDAHPARARLVIREGSGASSRISTNARGTRTNSSTERGTSVEHSTVIPRSGSGDGISWSSTNTANGRSVWFAANTMQGGRSRMAVLA